MSIKEFFFAFQLLTEDQTEFFVKNTTKDEKEKIIILSKLVLIVNLCLLFYIYVLLTKYFKGLYLILVRIYNYL